MARIAFLGLGRMGAGMAGRLIDSGHEVSVWNRTPAKADPLLAKGGRWAASPAAAAEGADAVFTMLADDTAAHAAWLGRDGALSAARKGAFAIECSTLSRPQVLRIATEAGKRGLRFIDCPVTGRPDAAAAGKLTLLIGASEDDLRDAQPLLQAISNIIRHFGPVGSGTAYKLMINLMGSVQIAALAEGIVLAERLGLDRGAVVAAIEDSAAASRQVVHHARRMAERQFADPSFTASLRHKDAACGTALAAEFGCSVPLGDAATAWWAAAKAFDPDGDEGRLVEVIEKRHGSA